MTMAVVVVKTMMMMVAMTMTMIVMVVMSIITMVMMDRYVDKQQIRRYHDSIIVSCVSYSENTFSR